MLHMKRITIEGVVAYYWLFCDACGKEWKEPPSEAETDRHDDTVPHEKDGTRRRLERT